MTFADSNSTSTETVALSRAEEHLSIAVGSQSLSYLSQHGRAKLEAVLKDYCEEVLQEAGRLEGDAKSRAGERAPEITAVHIGDADSAVRRKPKVPRWYFAAKWGSLILPYVSATFWKLTDDQHLFWIAPLILTVGAAAIVTLLVSLKESGKL